MAIGHGDPPSMHLQIPWSRDVRTAGAERPHETPRITQRNDDARLGRVSVASDADVSTTLDRLFLLLASPPATRLLRDLGSRASRFGQSDGNRLLAGLHFLARAARLESATL